MYDVLGEERLCSNCNVDTWLQYDRENIELRKEVMMDQLQDLGYETVIALKNLGSIGTMLSLYALKLAITGVMAILVRVNGNKRLKKYYTIFFNQVFFGDLFAILIDSYYEILISGYLELGLGSNSVSSNKRQLAQIPFDVLNGDKVSKISIQLFIILALGVVPCSLYYVYS